MKARHLSCREWGSIPIGPEGFSREQADALIAAAADHPAGGTDGGKILVEINRRLHVRQVVGVLAVPGASLEILPKVDEEQAEQGDDEGQVRHRLVHMLDVALGLDLAAGAEAAMARQDETLLDVLIRLFAHKLLAQVRRGLPRHYVEREDDLRALRGRLDITRQFTVHAARPDRLACRFDSLENDTPLMRVMKACVIMLSRHARGLETQRLLAELRHALDGIPDTPASALPWKRIRIDRSNQRWRSLLDLAKLFLLREWQATHHEAAAAQGLTLLFPMNDLFEAYIAARLRQSLTGSGIDVVEQGGLRHCLGPWSAGEDTQGIHFLTRPDLILRQREDRKILAIIDTKWKRLDLPRDERPGVAQADIYQMMAYARLYRCDRLMLLYPSCRNQGSQTHRDYGFAAGRERLFLATIDLNVVDGVASALKRAIVPQLVAR